MKTFIRAAEVWLPDAGHAVLTHGAAVAGPEATSFCTSSQGLRFKLGEGLPGLAWQQGRPMLLRQLHGLPFLRAEAARAARLSSAIALPVFVRGELTAVLALFCGDDLQQAGAIEIWRNDPRVTTDMTLVEGVYSQGADALEAVSHDTYLPRGTGLPGLAWQQGHTVFMDDLASAPRFLRGASARDAGIERGLAVPWAARTQAEYVVTLLCSSRTPVAQRLECWVPGDAPDTLRRAFGFDEALGPMGDAARSLSEPHDPVSDAFLSGVPRLEALADGTLVAVPVVSEGEVAEVLLLTL
jgi:putative methionine-R-sulfoxide reductase with GAF domain